MHYELKLQIPYSSCDLGAQIFQLAAQLQVAVAQLIVQQQHPVPTLPDVGAGAPPAAPAGPAHPVPTTSIPPGPQGQPATPAMAGAAPPAAATPPPAAPVTPPANAAQPAAAEPEKPKRKRQSKKAKAEAEKKKLSDADAALLAGDGAAPATTPAATPAPATPAPAAAATTPPAAPASATPPADPAADYDPEASLNEADVQLFTQVVQQVSQKVGPELLKAAQATIHSLREGLAFEQMKRKHVAAIAAWFHSVDEWIAQQSGGAGGDPLANMGG